MDHISIEALIVVNTKNAAGDYPWRDRKRAQDFLEHSAKKGWSLGGRPLARREAVSVQQQPTLTLIELNAAFECFQSVKSKKICEGLGSRHILNSRGRDNTLFLSG